MDDLRRLYGTDEPPAAVRHLVAGALEADLVDGNLRAIRFGGRELIRAIGYVVRDRDWGTYDLGVDDPAVEADGNGFTVTWEATCTAPGGAALSLVASIRGQPSGRLVFDVTATPDAPFETNRCGFCILHPIEGVAGRPVAVTHSDGTVERSVFPDLIEPWQPFEDIAAIRHEAAPGVAVSCRMEGDTFEMEDQRAWSDASYKTYVRPLALPWPYELAAGAPNRQRVVVEIEAVALDPGPPRLASELVTFSLGEAAGERFPAFGLLVSPEDADEILAAPERVGELAPRHLLLHFDPTAGHAPAEMRALATVRALAPGIHAMLEYVVPCERDLDAEFRDAARLVADTGLRLDAVTVGPSVDRRSTTPGSAWPRCPPLADIYGAARRAFPDIRLGGGMFSYFTELNRKRPPVSLLDYVTHATCPIVHAADDLSVMQTLEAIPFVTRSARAVIGAATPYHLGPTTIGMRQNPYGSRTMPNPANRRVAMAADDPRGRGLFAAAWIVGYAARLAGAGIERWTGGSLAGPRGLLRGDGVVPAFHAAKALAADSGLPSRRLRSSAPAEVDGFAVVADGGRLRLRLANLAPRSRPVLLPSGFEPLAAAILAADASTPRPLAVEPGRPFDLPPYAVAFVEGFASSAD